MNLHPMPSTVLIADDDEDIRETLAEILQTEGYQVAMASSGWDAIEYLKTSSASPSVILLDLMMPEMDGMEFRQLQKQNSDWATIPVIVLSAVGNPAKKAEEMGVMASLRKPLNIDQLLDLLTRACATPPSLMGAPRGSA